MRISFPTEQAWGALRPYTPSGDGCERVATLSSSSGAALTGTLFFDGTGATFPSEMQMGVLVAKIMAFSASFQRIRAWIPCKS